MLLGGGFLFTCTMCRSSEMESAAFREKEEIASNLQRVLEEKAKSQKVTVHNLCI